MGFVTSCVVQHTDLRPLVSIHVSVQKQEESALHCVYDFGGPDAVLGRLILEKRTGDIEIERLSTGDAAPNERFVLAQVVARLQSYHERQQYPDADEWAA